MENQNAQSLVEEGLAKNEFGINQLAEFVSLGKPKLKINKDGTATLTLEYKIVNEKEIIPGPKTPDQIPFNAYAAFDNDKADHFKEALSVPEKFSVDVDSSDNITLATTNAEILLITNAKKRENGNKVTKPAAQTNVD